MAGPLNQCPTPGSPSSGASVAGSDEPEPSQKLTSRLAGGRWVAFLIYALVLLLWIVLAAEAAYQHQWANFAGYTCIALFFLVVPTGVVRRLGRMLKGRKPRSPRLAQSDRLFSDSGDRVAGTTGDGRHPDARIQ
jgi:hypothetical protein